MASTTLMKCPGAAGLVRTPLQTGFGFAVLFLWGQYRLTLLFFCSVSIHNRLVELGGHNTAAGIEDLCNKLLAGGAETGTGQFLVSLAQAPTTVGQAVKGMILSFLPQVGIQDAQPPTTSCAGRLYDQEVVPLLLLPPITDSSIEPAYLLALRSTSSLCRLRSANRRSLRRSTGADSPADVNSNRAPGHRPFAAISLCLCLCVCVSLSLFLSFSRFLSFSLSYSLSLTH